MLRDLIIFAGGMFLGVGALMALIRLPHWLHEHTRKQALRGRMDSDSRWLH
jgi:hypothetical protein